MPISSTAPSSITSNLRRWTTRARPMCWFSATAACRWRCPTMRRTIGSSARRLAYYLLAFSYNEDMVFTEELLRRMNPRASVYIINVDDFFERRETAAAKTILHDPDARSRYEWKRFAQRLHQPICGAFPKLCGRRFVIFRSRETGAYYRIAQGDEPVLPQNAVSYDPWVDQAVVKDSTALAIDFLNQYAKGKCVILTNVPYPETKIGNAEAIASGRRLAASCAARDGRAQHDRRLSPRPAERRSLVESVLRGGRAQNSLLPREQGRGALLSVR